MIMSAGIQVHNHITKAHIGVSAIVTMNRKKGEGEKGEESRIRKEEPQWQRGMVGRSRYVESYKDLLRISVRLSILVSKDGKVNIAERQNVLTCTGSKESSDKPGKLIQLSCGKETTETGAS
mgnify:CR=1 FL=1